MSWYLLVLRRYAVFRGRAPRREYWMFFLWNAIISGVLAVVDTVSGRATMTTVLLWTYTLAVLLPGTAVVVRRLHDTGSSGRWFIVSLIPVLGAITLFIRLAKDSEPGANEYGPNPKDAAAMHGGQAT